MYHFPGKQYKTEPSPFVLFLAAGVLHWAAAAGVAFFAVVDGADDCYDDEAGYGDDCDYCGGIHKTACAIKYPNHATTQATAHWNSIT